VIRRQVALIQSMTKKERANPSLLQASRKKRIAKGAGLEVSELNKLLKMQRQMGDMMKKLGKKGGKGMLKQALGGMFGSKGGPQGLADMDPAKMAEATKQLQGKLPGGMGGLPGLGGSALPPGLSGFGKKSK
jgi:signal recognition particle subunit SRP54